MLPHTGLFLLWKVALQMRIRRPFGFIGNLKFWVYKPICFIFDGAPILRSYSQTGRNSSKFQETGI
ncbi:hypothetical protein [Neisseria mucosa]|nr:hypothetical protein [Neisseria mucosa]